VVLIVFVYVYVVIVNKHHALLWITRNFAYGSTDCGIDNPAAQRRTGSGSQGKLLRDLASGQVYQGFAHKVSDGLYKSYTEGVVDKRNGVIWMTLSRLTRRTCRGHLPPIFQCAEKDEFADVAQRGIR
jgi:hypothetical protein